VKHNGPIGSRFFPATAKPPEPHDGLRAREHEEKSTQVKIGICQNDFAVRLVNCLQIGLFNIASMTEVIPDQKGRFHMPGRFQRRDPAFLFPGPIKPLSWQYLLSI
jgi:hypothetical protein